MFDILPTPTVVYILVLAAAAGAFLGSGLNCLAWRMARGEAWTRGRSRCPQCGATLKTPDLIPVFSYIFLKGKCRHCGAPVPKRYVLAELGLAVIFCTVTWRYQLSFDTLSALVLCACLFTLSLHDLDTQIIPDRFLVIPAAVRLLQLLLTGGVSGLLSGALPGLILGGGVLAMSLIMDKVLKKDTMGGGDIKLLAVLGLFFPLSQCLFLLLAACLIGIAMAAVLMKVSPDTPFPFGPALSLAAWITMLLGEGLVGWYLSLF